MVPVSLRRAWRHQPGLKADVAVAHFALDFGLGDQRGDGIDDDTSMAPHCTSVSRDFQRLLAGVRLRNQKVVDVHAEFAGVGGVESMFGVDEGGDSARLLAWR